MDFYDCGSESKRVLSVLFTSFLYYRLNALLFIKKKKKNKKKKLSKHIFSEKFRMQSSVRQITIEIINAWESDWQVNVIFTYLYYFRHYLYFVAVQCVDIPKHASKLDRHPCVKWQVKPACLFITFGILTLYRDWNSIADSALECESKGPGFEPR